MKQNEQTQMCNERRNSNSERRKLKNIHTDFPKAIPEIPVRDVEKAVEYYVDVLRFCFD